MTDLETIIFQRLENQEMRIRKLEKAYWKSLGMYAMAAFVGSTIAAVVLKLI